MLIDSFLNEVITTTVGDGEEHKYKITNAIGSILFSKKNTDMLYYPSIQNDLRSINICMKPEKADELLKSIKFYMVEIISKYDSTIEQNQNNSRNAYKVRVLQQSREVKANGDIIWGGPSEPITA